jgi:hypothetical protein
VIIPADWQRKSAFAGEECCRRGLVVVRRLSLGRIVGADDHVHDGANLFSLCAGNTWEQV